MPTEAKARNIEQTKEWYSKASGVVFTDYRGLKVKEIQQLRSDLRKKGGELHVVKNTLFRIAAGDDAAKLPADLHNGTTAFAFVFENEADVAKTLLDYARTSKKLIVKGGFFGGRAFDSKEVEALSQLPPKDVLIAQVIGAIAAPLTTLIGTIEALYADPIRTIGAVADKVAEGSPIPETAAVETSAAAETPSGEPVASEAVSAEEAPSQAAATEAAPTDPASSEEVPLSEPNVTDTPEATASEPTENA